MRALWLIVGLSACDPSAARLFYDGVSPPNDTRAAGGGEVGTGGDDGTGGAAGAGGNGYGGSSAASGGGPQASSGTGETAPECTAENQCPVGANECERPTCLAWRCGIAYVREGELTSVQHDGDCLRFVCNGFGYIRSELDPNDAPSDNNPCTIDRCEQLVPTYTFSPLGSLCPVGVCDGAGRCMPRTCTNTRKDGAETDVDCGGPECPGCSSGRACQTHSDCASRVCSASGACACDVDHLVISEIMTRGSRGADDEFVEILNPMARRESFSGNIWIEANGTNLTTQLSVFMAPGERYVIAGPEFVGARDATTDRRLDDTGYASLVSNGRRLDTVCYCVGADCDRASPAHCEGERVRNPASSTSDRSMARKPTGAECVDSDRNLSDFVAQNATPGAP